MCFKYKVNLLDKKFILINSILLLWNIIQIFYTKHYKISPFPFIEIFITYIIIKIYSNDIFYRFEKVCVGLSKISIIGWILCLISHDTMLKIANLIGSAGARISQSIYIFSVPIGKDNTGFILRNCGFSWEPGRFSCILIIALFINIARNNLNIKDKNFIILSFALISAQSTTGYIVFIIMLATYYIWNKKVNPIYIGIFLVAISSVATLPFMKEKLTNLYSNSLNIEQQVYDLIYLTKQKANEEYYVPQRFDGFMFQLINLRHTPLLIGEGRDFTQFYLNKEMGFQIVASEGILAIIIQYGIIMALGAYYLVFRSSRILCPQCPLLFFLIFIMINFSYSLWEPPLIMAIWMYDYFNKKNNLCR